MDVHALEGHWYIMASTLKFWKKNTRKSPQLNYHYDGESLRDWVVYDQNGKQKTLKGRDEILDEVSMEFKYKGMGPMFLFSAKWRVELAAPDNSWMVLSFEDSAFTGGGIEIISRDKLSESQLNTIKRQIEDHPALSVHLPHLSSLQ